MKTKSIALALALLCGGAAATAQTTPAAPSGAENDVNSPDVAAANRAVAAEAATRENAVAAVNAENQATAEAQYAADLAAYRNAVRAHNREVARDTRIAERQERAYADAMRDWRRQVYACKHGSTRACNAPSPNPADYW